MAPDAESGVARGEYQPVGRARVHADGAAPARAWLEREPRDNARGPEHRRLLSPHHATRAALPDVCPVHKKLSEKTEEIVKTQFQIRKEKFIAVLDPPYFILCMVILIVSTHALTRWSDAYGVQNALEWAPGSWWCEPWRVLTYGCVHASAAHLALNAVVALAVGWRLESEQGWWRVAVVWWCGVGGGALGAGALQPDVRVVGASAAVYALLTAHLPNVCLRFGHVPLWWFRPLSVLVLGTSEGCWAVAQALKSDGPGQPIAWAAHALGAAVGVPLGFLIFTGENSNKCYIKICRVISIVVLLVEVNLAVFYYTIWADHR